MIQTKEIPLSGVYIFKSCQVAAEYPGVESSTLFILDKLGVDYFNDPMQCCCTGMGYYCDLFPELTVVALAARNFYLALKSGHPNIAVFCSTCYAINKKSCEIMHENPRVLAEVNATLRKLGMSYNNQLDVRSNHFQTVEILWALRKEIAQAAKYRLDGLVVAVHPACHYCKVYHGDTLTDPSSPTFSEEILMELGAKAVPRYGEKMVTCGAGFRQRFTNKSMSLAVTNAKLEELHKLGVEALLHFCPNCHVQFDRYQPLLSEVAKIPYTMAQLHVQQLVALAMGADPESVVGIQTHSVDLEPLLHRLKV